MTTANKKREILRVLERYEQTSKNDLHIFNATVQVVDGLVFLTLDWATSTLLSFLTEANLMLLEATTGTAVFL